MEIIHYLRSIRYHESCLCESLIFLASCQMVHYHWYIYLTVRCHRLRESNTAYCTLTASIRFDSPRIDICRTAWQQPIWQSPIKKTPKKDFMWNIHRQNGSLKVLDFFCENPRIPWVSYQHSLICLQKLSNILLKRPFCQCNIWLPQRVYLLPL